MNEKFPEKKSEQPLPTLDDVFKDSPDSNPLLGKGHSHMRGFKGAVNDLKISNDLKENLASGRVIGQYHILRLLGEGRSEAERSFGLAYLEHGPTFLDDLQKKDWDTEGAITKVIAVEGYDTTMFWTFAPYLYASLVEHGIESGEAVHRILLWAKDGKIDDGSGFDPKPRLKGLEEFGKENYDRRRYVLSENPQGASHLFTKEKAKKIVEDFLLTKEEKKQK